METATWAGLALYVLVVLGGVVGLLFDAHRFVTGQLTITEWATAKPIRAVVIVLATLLGPIGLAVHFLFFR